MFDDDVFPFTLSEYGSYVAIAGHKNRITRICVWKTGSNDTISIPLCWGDEVQDLDLTWESAHLVAVAHEDITILSISSGAVQRTLYHQGVRYVRISHDGSFLASQAGEGEAILWSITQGTLLATFETSYDRRVVFSRANRWYAINLSQDNGRVYDLSADPKKVIKSFPLPSTTE